MTESVGSLGRDGSRRPRQDDWGAVGGIFRALGAPLRVGIVVLLDERPRSVGELVDQLGVSQPLVSQHLRVLRGLGLVDGQREGRSMIYALSDAQVSGLVAEASQRVNGYGNSPG